MMMTLIAWLIAASAVPVGPLVFVTGGVSTAIVLTALLLVTLSVIAWQHEPRTTMKSQQRIDLQPTAAADSHLPRAA